MAKRKRGCPLCKQTPHHPICALGIIEVMHQPTLGDWETPKPVKDHGFALIHISTYSEAEGALMPNEFIERLTAKVFYGFTITPAWGYFGQAPEPSYIVGLVNGAGWALPWGQFRSSVRTIVPALAEALGQKRILVEYLQNGGHYMAEEYVNTMYINAGPQPVPIHITKELGPYTFPVA